MSKGRKGRRQREAEENSEPEVDDQTAAAEKNASPFFKDMEFTQRRALQRQQAAEKRRSKQKCYLCGRAGHVRRQCPGIMDDGRGMSHYKGKSDKAAEKQKLMERRRKRHSSGNQEAAVSEVWPEYPEAFCVKVSLDGESSESTGLSYYDVHCDLGASLNYMRQGRGKNKISHKAAVAEYRAALFMSNGLKAVISQTFLLKWGRPWTNLLASDFHGGDDDDNDDCPVRLYFVLGLAPSFVPSEEALKNETIENVVATVKAHAEQILAIGATMDYSQDKLGEAGMDVPSQIFRLEVAWHAAGRLQVPLQLHLLPGAASLDQGRDSVAGTDYARVLLDAQSQMTTAVAVFPDLAIHVVGWCGKAAHMNALLQAFPRNIQAVGLDGTVTFAKATDLHECAFDIPLDKLVIETASVIPSQVNHRLGRTAFFHSGWWPFVAQSVADHKKSVSVHQVVQAANENARRLYPRLNEECRESSNKEDDLQVQF